MALNYLLLDVFTTEPLTGNQLAVVLRAENLLDDQMQAIAKEFALSETVFISKPREDRYTARVRIFTPAAELPFAGHPTVGAAVVLALQKNITVVRLEEEVGLVTCLVDKIDKRTGHARFALPQPPQEMGKAPDRHVIAMALGVDLGDIGCGAYQPSVFSAGVTFYLVPVRNAAVLARATLNRGGWADVFPLGNHFVYVFTQTPEEQGIDFAARMFSPTLGEDPGTGSAAAALAGLISRHSGFADGQAEYQIRQGVEMGRPCRISVQIKKENGEFVHGGIGGHAVIVGEGALDLEG